MKKGKLLLTALLCMSVTAIAGAAACQTEEHKHTWGDWTIKTDPTLTQGGKAEHYCTNNADGHEEVNIPALSDTSVWTKDANKSTPATHTAGGKDVYTSEYGEVEIVIDATGHTWGDWALVTEPTLTTAGSATHTCTAEDGGSETKNDVPALSDTGVWTKDAQKSTPATHVAAGKDVYTSVYGEVEVEIAVQAHTWGEWVFTTEPTLETAGSATRTCTAEDGGSQTESNVPALSDTSVWTKDAQKSTPAAHAVAGKDVYTSEYGEVEVVIDAIEHTWGEWTLTKEPTLEAAGSATRTCTAEDGGSQTKDDVPALSDTTVWTVTEHTDATYEKGEVTVYSSVYGTVTVEDGEVLSYFANKTYYSITFVAYSDYGTAQIISNTTGNHITLDKNGTGTDGTGRPFIDGYTYKFEMVNVQTGEISITRISSSGTADDPVKAFYDSETGFIVMPNFDDFKNVHVLVTSGAYDATYDSIVGSVWTIDEAFKFAITYTDGNGTTETDDDAVHNILIDGKNGDAVHFGVSFKNGEGEALPANEAYNSDYLYITDKDGEQIGAYGKDGNKLVAVDGLEGEYALTVNEDITQEGSKIFLSGFGTATLTTDGTHNGTYTVMESEECDVLVVFADLNLSYYLTFNEGGSATLVIPRVTLSFELNGHGTITKTQAEVIPGLVYELEEPANDDATIVFMGWYYDADFTKAVETPFIPVDGGTIYAKWSEVPKYVGTFQGGNIYNASSGSNLSNKTIIISAKGEISGTYTGKVTDYNSETQLITWVDSSSNVKYFIFDEASKTIVTRFSSATNSYFDHDIDFYSMYATSVTHYGIKYMLPEHTDLNASKENLRVVELKVDAEGTVKSIVLYYNRIYGNVTLTNLDDEALTVSTVKDADSLLVKDAATNAFILGVKAASGTLSGSNNVPLDAYFGTYTDQNSKTIVLDGTGKITYDGVDGTYTVAEEGEYTISALVGEGEALAYYEITISGTSATTAKPTVEITLDLQGVTVAELSTSIVCNKNVPITLPVLTDSEGTYLFDGWYVDGQKLTPVDLSDGKYTPAENATIYAGWIKKLTVHVHYNNTEVALEEYVYVGDGKTLTVEEPQGICDGKVFNGFYTTEGLTEGSAWTNGSVVTEGEVTDLYASWVLPVPYYGTFKGLYISSGNHPTSYVRNPLDIDAFGHAVGLGTSNSNKETGDISEYDETTGKFKFFTTGASYYSGAFDAKNGVMVVDTRVGSTEEIKPLSTMFIVLFRGATDVSFTAADGSQWNNAATTLITFTVDGEQITVFIHENRIYGNVSIYSVNGSVTAGNAYEATSFAVIDSDGNDIAVFKNGEFVSPDGLRGAYSNTSGENIGSIVVDGADNIIAGESSGTYTVTGDSTIEAVITVVESNASTLHGYTIVLDTENKTYTATETQLEKVTVTLIFAQDGLSEDAQVTVEIISGTTPDLSAYTPKGANSLGYYFIGWCEDAERQTAYTPSELSEDKVIYGSWASAYTVEDITTASYHWTESDGVWSISGGAQKKSVYLKISFVAAGTFTFDYDCKFEDNGYDALYGHLNTTKPEDVATASRLIKILNGSGTSTTVTVNAGDYLCISASWDNYSPHGTNDYVHLSNFQFVAAE